MTDNVRKSEMRKPLESSPVGRIPPRWLPRLLVLLSMLPAVAASSDCAVGYRSGWNTGWYDPKTDDTPPGGSRYGACHYRGRIAYPGIDSLGILSAGSRLDYVELDGNFLYGIAKQGEGDSGPSSIVKMPMAGGAPATLVSGIQGRVTSFRKDAASLYWSVVDGGQGTIAKVSLDGGKVLKLVEVTDYVDALALDGDDVYFRQGSANDDTGRIMKVRCKGGRPVVVVKTEGHVAKRIAFDAQSMFWAAAPSGSIRKMARAGGEAESLAGGSSIDEIAVDGGFVYWLDDGQREGQGALRKVPVAGGTATTLADHLENPRGLVLDAEFVYFADDSFLVQRSNVCRDGTAIQKVPRRGGPRLELLPGPCFSPLPFVVTNDRVYWSCKQSMDAARENQVLSVGKRDHWRPATKHPK